MNNKYNIVVLGDSTVGKSSLILQFLYDKFIPDNSFTNNIFEEEIIFDNESFNLSFYEITGNENTNNLHDKIDLIDNIHGIIFVYSINSGDSFDTIKSLRKQFLSFLPNTNIPMVIIANKSDLHDERQVSSILGKSLADCWNYLFFESSAKLGNIIKEPFYTLIQEINKEQVNKHKDINLQQNNLESHSNFNTLPSIYENNSNHSIPYEENPIDIYSSQPNQSILYEENPSDIYSSQSNQSVPYEEYPIDIYSSQSNNAISYQENPPNYYDSVSNISSPSEQTSSNPIQDVPSYAYAPPPQVNPSYSSPSYISNQNSYNSYNSYNSNTSSQVPSYAYAPSTTQATTQPVTQPTVSKPSYLAPTVKTTSYTPSSTTSKPVPDYLSNITPTQPQQNTRSYQQPTQQVYQPSYISKQYLVRKYI